MENLENESKYLRARERVAEIRKFYSGLISYVIVISALAGINYYTDGLKNPWFLWPALGWGLGLCFHYAKAFDHNPFLNRSWEDRKIKEYMDKEERRGGDVGRWE